MNWRWRLVAMAAALALAGMACTSEMRPSPPPPPPPSVPSPDVPIGGTLRAQLVSDVSAAFDPQKEYYSLTFELFRCCLLRTLLATNGRDAQHGGTELRPDLAASLPTVSADGLTWTFHLKPGIHYAPPLQNLTVTSADFIRALEREACSDCSTGGYDFYYSVIEGFEAARNAGAKTIVGLSAPDPLTLRVRLNQPAGDLGYLFALGATAPIPPNPFRPADRLGIAEGHTQDFGRFLIGTGPYMFWHQSRLDFSEAVKEQEPTAGYRPGRSITLVRNPSWVACRCDDLRPAYVDEMDFRIGGTPEAVTAAIGNGRLDIGPDSNYSVADTYATNPLPTGLHVYPTDTVRYLSFNLALPPFDDIHVRKAVNLAIDKDGLRRLVGGPQVGAIATHAIPDGLETIAGRVLLAGFDPYATSYEAGDVDKARAEMRLSKYDSNGDGVCDAPICRGVLAFTSFNDPYTGQAALIQHGLHGLGITLEVRSCERCPLPFGESCRDPASHTAFCLNQAWTKDYPDAFGWWVLLDSSGLYPDCCNASLLGASPKFLRKYHYSVTSVPSVDSDFDRCEPLTGDQRVRCLAELDRRLMTEIVPWVPYLFDNRVTLLSSRMRNFTWDAFTGVASFDHLALRSASPTG